VQETKNRLILSAVAETEGNITRAAARLGLQPTYLHRLIRNLDLRDELGKITAAPSR
jgi:transcriptional regulator with GAF, ATPase, and Fis domain